MSRRCLRCRIRHRDVANDGRHEFRIRAHLDCCAIILTQACPVANVVAKLISWGALVIVVFDLLASIASRTIGF